MQFTTVHRLAAPGGASIPYRFAAAERPRGAVQILHGLAEHSARYARFARALNAAGYHVYAQDHRGHGVNINALTPKGFFAVRDGYKAVLADVLALNRHIRAEHPGLPVVLFGHSMGGLIALNYLFGHADTVDAAAIWNANVDGGLESLAALAILKAERMLKGSDVPSGVLPKLTFRAWGRAVPGHRTLFDWLSHDAAEVDAYVADPLCGFDASVALWIDVFRMIRRGADDRNLARVSRGLPLHLLGGAEDPATANGAAVRRLGDRMRALGFGKVDCGVLPGMRHESLNEIGRDAVARRFVDWLDRWFPAG